MNVLRRGVSDKGCIDIMYLTIEYPNYPIISLLTQPRGNSYYLTDLSMAGVPDLVILMYDASNRGAWFKGCVDVIQLIIEHPNYLTISLLTQQGRGCESNRLEFTRKHVVVEITTCCCEEYKLLL